jgi:BirA family biotin operon repressor/biotin-[acetyl-CoA-carboxylase] ligase
MLLYPAFLSASRQFHLSMMTSLALIDTLVEHGVEVSIKWPNDILVPSGKIAGILIENGIMGGHLVHSIIGIGLNVNQSIFPDFPIKASSLAMETSRRLDPALLAKEISNRILERFNQLKIGTGPSLQEEYLEHLYQLDQPSLFISEGREFIGVIRGINEFGELQVETGSSVKTFSMHSIRLKG